MTFKKIYETENNNQLVIELPEEFKMKKVKVTVEEIDSDYEEKMKLIKSASEDPMFVADVNEVTSDFN